MNCPPSHRLHLQSLLFCALLIGLLSASPLFGKTAVDFNPKLDFSKYRSFAFLGGVENLLMIQLDRDLFDDRIHHSVDRELTKKGLREVQLSQNPDLVIRYWANPPQQVNVATMGNWGPYRPYIDASWAWIYNDVAANSVREGSLIIDLIDARSRDLTWRVYLIRRISNTDKDWKKADEELAKAFESYPPSDKEKEEKVKERDAHRPKAE